MLREALQWLADATHGQAIDVGGHAYTTHPVHLPPADPTPTPLSLYSLGAIIDYLDSEVDTSKADSEGAPTHPDANLLLHVASHLEVRLLTPLAERWRQRELLVVAKADVTAPELERPKPISELLVTLRTRFVKSEARDRVVQLLSNVSSGAEVRQVDDGVSQQVIAKVGVAQRQWKDVPSPLQLRRCLTFAEIDQPEGEYVLRLERADESGVFATLHSASEDKLRLAARKAIGEWLRGKLTETQHGNVTVLV